MLYIPIILYCIIAFGLAIPFNTSIINILPAWWYEEVRYLPAALGPFIGALIVGRMLSFRPVTLLGTLPLASVLVWLVPVIAFTLTGLNNPWGIQPNILGLLYAGINAIYALMEEAGWRGFMNNALQQTKDIIRYIIVGLIWWLWHMRFQTTFEWSIFPLIVVASAIALGKLADTTRSYMVTAGMHLLIIISTNGLGSSFQKLVAAGICIIAWIAIFKWLIPKSQQVRSGIQETIPLIKDQ